MEFTYDKYKLPSTEMVQQHIGQPALYAMPDEIIDATHNVAIMARRSVNTHKAELRAFPDSALSKMEPMASCEVLDVVAGVVRRIRPDFAQMVEDAADENRFNLYQVRDRQADERETRCYNGYDGRPVIEFEINGGPADIRRTMSLAGRLVALERTAGENDPEAAPSRTLALSAVVQTQFFERALLDRNTLTYLHPTLSYEMGRENRAIINSVSNDWLERYDLYLSAEREMQNLDQLNGACSAAFMLHNEMHTPAMFIAAGLYDSYTARSSRDRQAMLEAVFPSAGTHSDTEGVPPLANLLGLIGVTDKASLNQLFAQEANQLYTPAPLPRAHPQIELYRATAADVAVYAP